MSELNKYQTCFIDDNIGKMSVKKMAKHLGADKGLISEHIKKSGMKSQGIAVSRRSMALRMAIILAAAVIAGFAYLQHLSHRTYDNTIDISPPYPVSYYNLGMVYKSKGDIEMATAYFKKALKISPDFAAAQKELERLGGGEAKDL